MTAAPGKASRKPSCCGVDHRIISASTHVVTITVTATTSQCMAPFRSLPNTSTWLDTLVSSATTASASPATIIQPRLLIRLTTGLSRLLRGIAHTTLTAFCAAWPSPIAPYVAARMPITTAVVLPWMPSGRPSWSPTIGNWASAELRMRCSSSGSPCRTKPRTAEAISSSGRIAMNA